MAVNHVTQADWLALTDDCEDVADYFECQGVLFSASRVGQGLKLHVACERSNLKHLRSGCVEFIEHMLSRFEWCNMLIATVSHKNKSVINLCIKLGFMDLGDYQFEHGTGKLLVIRR